jgi:hypothetical protein
MVRADNEKKRNVAIAFVPPAFKTLFAGPRSWAIARPSLSAYTSGDENRSMCLMSSYA